MKAVLSLNQQTKKWIALCVALLLIGSVFLFGYAKSPVDDRAVQTTVYIPKRASLLEIVDILDQAGMVKNKVSFTLLALLKGGAGKIKAGEYDLVTSMSPSEIINKLLRDNIMIHRVTIPGDFALKQIADLLVEEKLVSEENFLSVTTDTVFLASLNIDARSAEGYLYPDTYAFNQGMTAQEIVRTMVNQFWKKVTPQMIERAKEMGMTTTEFVTLASIICKYSGSKEEKAMISAVFHNRLKRGMKLQSDPTAIYGLERKEKLVNKGRKYYRKSDTPYNTYRIMGLPPGPIANPDIDSLYAALYPAPVDDIYIMTNRDGTYKFSTNIDKHGVYKWK
jgi:UPF0755 protein